MASFQRRNGKPAWFFHRKKITDSRGNIQWGPDLENPVKARVAEYPGRSSRAEVPGQQQINTISLIVPAWVIPDVENGPVGLWTEVAYKGRVWDIASPPAFHPGTRHSRHWTVVLRERPDHAGIDVGALI